MPVEFHHHDMLRLFIEIARYPSFSDAADALNMTKGAISYQIKTLEADLRIPLFRRKPRGVELTREGRHLLASCQSHYQTIETELHMFRGSASRSLTVGVSTYFATHWLSPRLMSFMQEHPDIRLRIQPMIRLFDLEAQGVDIAIRWGNGNWQDATITAFLPLPAFPVGDARAFQLVKSDGVKNAISKLTLLRDHDDSNAWTDWLNAAGLPHQSRRDTLIIPDPNVRVQAVIDGQGIALMDRLVSRELNDARLFRLSSVELSDYGYFLARPHRKEPSAIVDTFIDWISRQ